MTTNINNQITYTPYALSQRDFKIVMTVFAVSITFAIIAGTTILLGLNKDSSKINGCIEKASHSEICSS